MVRRDPYNHRQRWLAWKASHRGGIKGIAKHNADLIMAFLSDMEMGKNVSPVSRKGERSSCRLLSLKSRLLFFAQRLGTRHLDALSQDDIHRLAFDMRQGVITKQDGTRYVVGNYVKDFKSFWSWLVRTGRVKKDITVDLRRSDGQKPAWVYLTEEQFKTLANHANSDYRALMWFMYDTGIRVTEAYSVQVKDFSNDFTKLNIRQECAKTFGRTINLKLCTSLIRDHVLVNNLQPDDFIFTKKPCAFNKYLRELAGRMFGTAETLARKPYNKMRLYDIRHNASCYWLKRYPNRTGLMYRMGWSEEKEVRYYSEFLGQADCISDDDMIVTEDKTKYEKRIELLERDRQQTNALVQELMRKITQLQAALGSAGSQVDILRESCRVYSADRPSQNTP